MKQLINKLLSFRSAQGGEKSLLHRIKQKTKGFLHLIGGQVTFVRNDNHKVGVTRVMSVILSKAKDLGKLILRLVHSFRMTIQSHLQGLPLQMAKTSRYPSSRAGRRIHGWMVSLYRFFALLRMTRFKNKRIGLITLCFGSILILALALTTKNISAAPWAPTAGNWSQRKQITLVNNSGATLHANTTYKISIDTATLYNAGLLVSTCDDLRIFYQPNDTTSIELKRNLEYASTGSASATCTTSTSTQIVFALQADMANGANSSSYYIYYDNPDAPAYAAADALDAYNVGSKEATFVAPFNGTTTALAAGSGTPTTESGAIRYSGSKSALSFDGQTSGYADGVSGIIGLSVAQSFTCEFWFYNSSLNASSTFPFLRRPFIFDSSNYAQLSNNATTLTFYLSGATQHPYATIATDAWSHVALVYDGSVSKLYVNGAVSANTSNSFSTSAFSSYQIGNQNTWYGVNGLIDEFRISNTIRYTANFTPQTSPFVRDEYTKLLLHFDENGDDPRNTGKAIDDSGNGNHGTITGAKYVVGLVGVDPSTSSGQVASQSYASHQGVFIEEGTTNKITNPSFEHSTYNTNWAQPSIFDYDSTADTFTAGMAKRNSAGPFAAGVMAQGTSQGSASSGDVVTMSLGTTIASKFSSNLDADQGSIVLWWTPEFSDGDHGYSYLASAANGGIYLRYEYYYGGSPAYRFRFASGSTSSVYSKAVTAGTTYCIVFRWDSKNTLDGTNYYSLSVDDAHAFSVSTPQSSTPTSPFYLGNWSTMQANGIIEGLTIYRRPLFDGTYGIDVGNGDEINLIYNSGTGKDPTLVTGSWDVVFALPTNSSTGSLSSTGNAWSHPHASNLLYTSTTNTGGFMMNGIPATDGWTEIPWYKVGGASGVVAAYQPIGAADLSSSYVNKANPGTYDVTPGIAPTWDATNGWVFDGATTWLDTGWVPAYSQDQSMIAQFTGPTIDVTQFLLGSYNGASKAFVLTPLYGGTRRYWNGGTYGVVPGIGSGIKVNLAVAGAYGYKDGVIETGGPLAGWPSATTTSLYIGAARSTVVGDLPTGFSSSNLQAFAIYSTTLSSTQVANVTDAMEALTSSGTYLTPTALATSEKIFAGGYKFTSTGANQGISRSFTATNGGDYVLRAMGHSDGTCNPQIKITRADGSTTLTTLSGTTTSTRTDPDVYIFTWESPAAENEQVQLINTASSGTCYWHQVEVLSNLLNNPSMESGSGDPWVPTGWSNYRSSVGQNGYSQTNYSSGNQSFKINVDDTNKGISISRAFTQSDFYGSGLWLKNDSGTSAILPINLSNNNPPTGGCMQNYSCTGWNDGYVSSSQTPKRIFGVSRVITTGTYGTYIMSSGGATVSYIDDVYLYSLNPVSLTITPATEANSLETSGLRIDGTDTLTQTVDSLTASSGKIKFKFTPRHSLAVADKFGSTFSNMTIFDARADTVNNRIWITPISTTSVLLRGTFNGTVVDATWSSATLNAGTTYEAEINYTAGGSLNLKIDGVQVATNTGVVAFGTVPTTAYFGANYAGGWQYDATFTIPTFTGIVTPTENTTVPYYKFGSKSVKLVASADGQYVTAINPGNTNAHTLSAYVYDGTTGNVGGIVSATIAKLVYGGSTTLTTTYTDVGGGWWRLSYSGAVANAAADYGIAVLSGKTVYVDGVQLEMLAYATTYTDGTMGSGYAWTGVANNSTSTRTATDLVYANTSNFTPSAGSVSFWIKSGPTNIWNDSKMHSFFTIGNGDGWIRKHSINVVQFYFGGSNLLIDSTSFSIDRWYYVVGTWDNSTNSAKLYVNSSSPQSGVYSTINTNLVSVGKLGSSDYTNSSISGFTFYSTVLSSTEVADLYYSGLGSHSEQAISTERYTDGEPPVLAWHLDDPSTGSGQTVHDSTTYLNHGTISGATWSDDSIGGGPNSKALSFDGVDDKISRTYANDTELSPALQSFSVGGWFKSPSTGSGQTRIILSRYNGSGYKLWMSATGAICFGVDDDSTWGPDDSTCTTTTYADSSWHQVLAIRGTSTITVYIDGVQQAQANTTISSSLSGNSPTLYVGIDSDGTSNSWSGFIDEVRIYNSARSEEQVNTEFVARGSNKGASVILSAREGSTLSNGLVGYWKMDEASWTGNPNEVVDSSGNANHGVRVADATTASGKFGNGGTFDGTGDYVNCGTGSSITSLTQFTIGGWVKTTNSGVNPFISFGELAPSLRLAHYGTRALIYLGSNNYRYFDNSPTNIFDNSWHYVAFVITGNGQDDIDNSKMYVDGKEQTVNLTYKVASPETKSFCKIAYNSQGNYTGSFDEVRIYNRALSSVEVRALYEYAPGPVAYWNMDEGTGQNANDISGNNNTRNIRRFFITRFS